MSELQEVIATATIRAFNQGLQMGRNSTEQRIIQIIRDSTIVEPSPFDDIPTIRFGVSPNQLLDLISEAKA
jgi:hypothetical protein